MPSITIDTTVDINASKDAIWDVLTDFASYSEWNPVMRIEGAPEVGTKLVVHLIGDAGRGIALAKGSSANSGAAYEAFNQAIKHRVEHLHGTSITTSVE